MTDLTYLRIQLLMICLLLFVDGATALGSASALVPIEEAQKCNIYHSFPSFVLAATRSFTSIVPVEKEYEFLTVVIFSLLGLLVALRLMVRFPELGAAIGEYNEF